MKANIEVRKVRGMGRGVFATKRFKPDDIIEECHVILFDQPQNAKHNPTQAYSFRWNKKQVAIALGNGSLYNHSYEPNACVVQDTRGLKMVFMALREIKPGEQILINYNGKTDCKDPLWFHS